MKLDWRPVTILFLFTAGLDLVFKGSNVPVLVGLEPLLILYLIFLSLGNFWQIHFLFLGFSFFCDLINLQPIGLTIAALYVAYLITGLINKVFNLMGEAKLIFDMIVLLLALLLKSFLLLLFQPQPLHISILVLALNLLLFVLEYLLLNKIFTNNVFTK
jgi:hypothetical protein